MRIQYLNSYSFSLRRNMELKIFGHSGLPFLVFPCQNGKFFDFEDNGMVAVVADKIESGQLKLICVSSIDEETWSAQSGHHDRIMLHEQWLHYIFDELMTQLANAEEFNGQKPMLTGASMGGYHAVNLYLRRPDLFSGCLSLSGLFHASYFFEHYQDEQIYFNSPVDFLSHMDINHPLVTEYRQGEIIICCGRGAWEDEAKEDARILKEQFERLCVDAWVDIWGEDVAHDWPWWRIQFPYFIERLIENAH